MTFQFPKTSYNSPEKEEVKSIVEQYRREREQGKDGIACTTQPIGTATGSQTGSWPTTA